MLNVSEGRNHEVIDAISLAAGLSLRDQHSDRAHNRSVFTLIDYPDELRRNVHALITAAMKRLDLRDHHGVHPRFGVIDVVPFVALDPRHDLEAEILRNEAAMFIAKTFDVPVFLYGRLADGTRRSLPDVRRNAFSTLAPDFGPREAHPARGASAVGARGVLVAWNLWLRGVSLGEANDIVKAIRSPEVRALAFAIGDFAQISCNLIKPGAVGPSRVYDQVRSLLRSGTIDHAELVGLVPQEVLDNEDRERWEQLGLSAQATIESRLV
ncbi:MAG: Formiminotransferase domain protein [Acidimicrobiaceae bacterium]|nr:Formiminotransferase domain protein [Acidimicrobiaceae bacterium]